MAEAPGTLEGWYALHDFRTLDWPRWKALPAGERAAAVAEAQAFLRDAEAHAGAPEGSSALYSIVGHKADLMFLHLRPLLEDLEAVETAFARTRLADFTSRPYSYVSVTELGLYEAQARGAVENPMDVPFVRARLKFQIPADKRYMVFYPMNKKRGEQINWYTLPLEERRGMMRSHGTIGHKYFGTVQQMITGSVGFDDWEWGVTLFTADALQFKKLVYEMRFDEVSAIYADFGPFLTGMRLDEAGLGGLLAVDPPG
jgi:peroxiredoxin